MRVRYALPVLFLAGMFCLAPVASAANVLANPDFEGGPTGYGATGWNVFGNVYTEAGGAGIWFACEGNQSLKIFGGFSGGFNVAGAFQEFPAAPNEMWELECTTHFESNDPMIGSQATGGNWAVAKIAYFDAGNNEIGSGEAIVLDGSYAADACHPSGVIQATAPAGTVKVQALLLYLQPAFDGGAAMFDSVRFENVTPTPTEAKTWGQIKGLFLN